MGSLTESLHIEYLPADRAEAAVRRLDAPWVADEGPLDARLWRWLPGEPPPLPLHPRGLAFDAGTTVVWDEDQVRVLRPADPEPADLEPTIVVRRSEVRVRRRFPGLQKVERIDYLQAGVLLASRYQPLTVEEAADA